MSIADEIKQWETYWNDLVYTICKGDPVQMREIVKFDVYDFFGFVDNFMRKK